MTALESAPGIPATTIEHTCARNRQTESGSARDVSFPMLEKQVEEIWRNVLSVSDEEMSANATFFDLGGQAISALRIVARIENDLGIRIDVVDLFDHPSLNTFVRHVVARAQSR
ncbi:acyl carrier protein [Streptosporangium sp. NPDC000396]|uniref:acyl carrier protein n=1 Tax=Streptosporangium sp. NPDC000396 TaxID=3366185 RepID=UPI00367FCB88